MPEKALSQVRVRIEQTSTDIRSAAEAALAGEKQAFEQTATDLVATISSARTEVLGLLEDGLDAIEEERPTEPIVLPPPVNNQTEALLPDSIRARAQLCVKRHILKNGAKGWPAKPKVASLDPLARSKA